MVVTLRTEDDEVVGLPDPAGGSFVAAGAFDRLIGRAGLAI